MKSTFKFLIGLITLVLFSFATSSCTKAGGNVDSKAIVGKWNLVNQVHKIWTNGEITHNQDETPDGRWGRTYEFKADGTGEKTSFNYIPYYEEYVVSPITKWKITGSKIKLTVVEEYASVEENFDIDELNDNTLIFSGTVEQKMADRSIQKHYVRYTYNKM